MAKYITEDPYATIYLDRSEWGDGPWNDELDRYEFEAHGFNCLMVRNRSGNWCGYVGVPPSHPWHGKSCDDEVLYEINVHGGLTYAEHCAGRICHVPKPGEAEHLFWLGFDTAHSGDYSPAYSNRYAMGGEVYRDARYARYECERLARQIADAA